MQGIYVTIALELSALLPGLCVPGLQTMVSRKLNHAGGHSLILLQVVKVLTLTQSILLGVVEGL